MTYPVLLRRAAGVVLAVSTALTAVALVSALALGGEGALVLLVILGALVAPTLIALVPLMRVAVALARGRHQGDLMLFWSLLFLVGPAIFALRFTVMRVLVGAVVLANVLYAVGTRSKHDPPG